MQKNNNKALVRQMNQDVDFLVIQFRIQILIGLQEWSHVGRTKTISECFKKEIKNGPGNYKDSKKLQYGQLKQQKDKSSRKIKAVE